MKSTVVLTIFVSIGLFSFSKVKTESPTTEEAEKITAIGKKGSIPFHSCAENQQLHFLDHYLEAPKIISN
jgi:hypothetical protein